MYDNIYIFFHLFYLNCVVSISCFYYFFPFASMQYFTYDKLISLFNMNKLVASIISYITSITILFILLNNIVKIMMKTFILEYLRDIFNLIKSFNIPSRKMNIHILLIVLVFILTNIAVKQTSYDMRSSFFTFD